MESNRLIKIIPPAINEGGRAKLVPREVRLMALKQAPKLTPLKRILFLYSLQYDPDGGIQASARRALMLMPSSELEDFLLACNHPKILDFFAHNLPKDSHLLEIIAENPTLAKATLAFLKSRNIRADIPPKDYVEGSSDASTKPIYTNKPLPKASSKSQEDTIPKVMPSKPAGLKKQSTGIEWSDEAESELDATFEDAFDDVDTAEPGQAPAPAVKKPEAKVQQAKPAPPAKQQPVPAPPPPKQEVKTPQTPLKTAAVPPPQKPVVKPPAPAPQSVTPQIEPAIQKPTSAPEQQAVQKPPAPEPTASQEPAPPQLPKPESAVAREEPKRDELFESFFSTPQNEAPTEPSADGTAQEQNSSPTSEIITPQRESGKKNDTSGSILKIIIVIILLAALGGVGFMGYKYKNEIMAKVKSFTEEQPVEPPPPAVVKPPTPPEPVDKALARQATIIIGIYTSNRKANSDKKKIEALGLTVAKTTKSEDTTYYRISAGSKPTREEADKRAAGIRSLGFSASVSGKGPYYISAGSYQDEASARKRALSLKASGYPARVSSSKKTKKMYTLSVTGIETEGKLEKAVKDLNKAGFNPKVRK